MKVTPMTRAIGADIEGADVRKKADVEKIKEVFAVHSVVSIRDQNLTPEEHIDFAEAIGQININIKIKKSRFTLIPIITAHLRCTPARNGRRCAQQSLRRTAGFRRNHITSQHTSDFLLPRLSALQRGDRACG